MKVKRIDLIEGCVISEDIYSKSTSPLVNKKTIVTKEILELLEAFLIEEVNIEKTLVNGDPFPNVESQDVASKPKDEYISFYSEYLKVVEIYKSEFLKWHAGSPVDILKIREMIIPLFVHFSKDPSELLLIHRYVQKNDYIFHHSVATGLISGLLAIKSNFSPGEAAQIALAGAMADCGLSKIDPKIIYKNGLKTREEEEEEKKHPLHSYKLLANIASLKDAVKIAILQHHERLDGSGYPLHETGNRIHKFSAIIAVADYFHQMCTGEGKYSQTSPYKVVEIMTEDSFGKFDIEIVQVLLKSVANFSLGSTLKLNDGATGDVMFVDSKSPLRPIIKVNQTNQMIDLRNQRSYFIDKLIKQ